MAKLKTKNKWDTWELMTLKVDKVIDLLAFGRVIDWKIVRYKLYEAIDEVWINLHNFRYHIKTNATLWAKYNDIKVSRRESMKDRAEDNLLQAMEGKGDFAVMESKDRARLSLDILKQTDKAYNPKIEIEAKTENMNFNTPVEELERMILELINE